MSSFPDSDYRESRSAPTVSRDKWALHAQTKLNKGYALIISDGRRNASFFLAGRGYEPCPYVTARRLVELRVVVATGKHPLGMLYTLSPDAAAFNLVPSIDPDDVDQGSDVGSDDDSNTALMGALDSLESDEDESDSDEGEEAEEDSASSDNDEL